ncbi:hypothetical protein jhhlp_007607 [Lomentospora prolificans]|uniref:DNA replication checkpoint mediator MRC1 domain-containing protein n=1 Tax=Lomentospora prolificans TaxID=41688 RepID=A0A2N3N027_9PEZI|nr:hypothetical protein jhhlp_007607 [Lomentospora prolificans]
MPSTRASSPAEGDSPPGTPFLSPKSKMKALLATVGSDSEDESSDENIRATRQQPTRSVYDSSETEDEIIRPRGRFAAQMLATAIEDSTHTNTIAKETTTAESARDYVRRFLQLGDDAADENTPSHEGDETGEDVPVTRKRLMPAVERESTPDVTEVTGPVSSPGLFVSPGQKSARDEDERRSSGNESDDETMCKLRKNARFQALVERKRREREAREAEEEAKKAARLARQQEDQPNILELFSDSEGGNTSSITDDEGGRQLSQKVRPSRKASKKAIEEMNRETQRMARSMQLAHQAKTKKKITKATLFEKFGFKPAGAATAGPAEEPKTTSSSRPTTPVSDVDMKDAETPPSSPPASGKTKQAPVDIDGGVALEDLPLVNKIASTSPSKVAATPKVDLPAELRQKRRVRVKLPPQAMNLMTIDSDDELSITTTKKSKLDAIFDRVPKTQTKDPKSTHAFRTLAQVTSPGKAANRGRRGEKLGMTPAELQAMLRSRVREQANQERQRRIEMLKAKGVVVQTEEERLKEIEEVEDIVARAREEAQEIMQREREEAKKEREERKKNGEADALDWDDSEDDGDYKEEDEDGGDEEEEPEERDLELSGSEDDGDDEAEDEEDEEAPNPLFENEADEEDEEKEIDAEIAEDDDELARTKFRRSRKTQVLSEDEDDDVAVEATPRPKASFFKSPIPPSTKSPAAPQSVLRSATKNFIPGLPVAPAGPAGLGLTQMFAATMDDSQSQMGTPSESQTPRPTFDPFARQTFIPNTQEMNDDDDIVMDSQPLQTAQNGSQGGMDLHYSQTQMRNLDSLVREESQLSDMIPFSQDGGLDDRTPLKERFVDVPDSTMVTVAFGGTPTQDLSHESPLVRRGRLRRKMDVSAATEDDEVASQAAVDEAREGSPSPNPSPEKDEFGFNTTAFGVMQKAARNEERRKKREEKLKEFNRKKSKAAEMIEEQAQESEDEYAGLGGVDEDDDSDEDLASVKDLIDDEKGTATVEDERKLAAFYADRERADDEKQVEKLFKDITTGMLRRKRANDYDLSDSDDGGEARKRMKRMQFAKMQKALFADERVKKIAENPGNQAFMKTLEDRESDDEMDIIYIVEDENEETEDSQSQQPQESSGDAGVLVPNSQTVPTKMAPNVPDRAPATMRRTKDGKKPSNIGEIRESLSSLLEEPVGSVIPPTEIGSDSESDNERPSTSRSNKENISPPRTSGFNRNGSAIRDRLSSKRQKSSSGSSTGPHAFSRSASQVGGYKPPTLLRRATSNSFMSNANGSGSGSSSTSTSGASTPSTEGGLFGGDKIRKGAAKGSSISFERSKGARPSAAEGLAQRRTERKLKWAEERLRAARGLLSSGKFE